MDQSLPTQIYLLAYNRATRRVRGSNLAYLLRAAALTDLLLGDLLVDDHGKARAVASSPPADPLLRDVYESIAASRPRPWAHWVAKDSGGLPRAVRDQLEAAGRLSVEPHRFLGIFPADRLTLRNEYQVTQRAADLAMLVRRGRPVGRIDGRSTAMVALAAAGELPAVFDRRARKQYKARLDEFIARTGPTIPALRKAIRAHAAASGGG